MSTFDDLSAGDLIEVTVQYTGRPGYLGRPGLGIDWTYVGHFRYATDDQFAITRPPGPWSEHKVVPRDRVRTFRKLDPMLHAATFYPGEQVYVRKYGNVYRATVRAPLATRVRVDFTMRNGRTRVLDVDAAELGRESER